LSYEEKELTDALQSLMLYQSRIAIVVSKAPHPNIRKLLERVTSFLGVDKVELVRLDHYQTRDKDLDAFFDHEREEPRDSKVVKETQNLQWEKSVQILESQVNFLSDQLTTSLHDHDVRHEYVMLQSAPSQYRLPETVSWGANVDDRLGVVDNKSPRSLLPRIIDVNTSNPLVSQPVMSSQATKPNLSL
jgi:hypothetical protein